MGTVQIFALSFWIGLSGAMMPGPLLALVVAQSQRRGFRAGPLAVLGHGLLELVLVVLLILGVGAALENRWFIGGMGLAGGAGLVWMGAAMLLFARKSRGKNDETLGTGERFLSMNPVLGGAAVSLLNPYWTLWWITVGLSLVTRFSEAGRWGLAVFFIGHVSSDLAWFSFISGASSAARRFLAGRAFRAIVAVCGAALSVFGLYFTWWGGRALLRGLPPA